MAELEEAGRAEFAPLLAFGLRCAEALGLVCGGVHLKLRWAGPPATPILLALTQGCSPEGGAMDELAAAAGGGDWDACCAAVAAASRPPVEAYPPPPPPRPALRAMLLFPPPPAAAGTLLRWHGEEQLRGLPSYHSHQLDVAPGGRTAHPPHPCRAAISCVSLLGEEARAVEADAGAVFSLLHAEVAPSGQRPRAQCAQQ